MYFQKWKDLALYGTKFLSLVVVVGMVFVYSRKIYTVLFYIIALFQTKKLELWKIRWILCYCLIAIFREVNVIISAAAAKDIFNFVEDAITTSVHAQTITNGLDEI